MKKKKTKFIEEFKQFIMRGNVVQMAVGIVIGAAFSAIITAFVSGIINPFMSLIIGKVDFSDLKIILRASTGSSEEIAIKYGLLIQKIVEFLIIGFFMFLVIKAMNKLENIKKPKVEEKPKEEEKKPEVPETVLLLREIKALLKNKNEQ